MVVHELSMFASPPGACHANKKETKNKINTQSTHNFQRRSVPNFLMFLCLTQRAKAAHRSAKTAPEALLGGSWAGLGGSWVTLGAFLGRLGPARSSRGRAQSGYVGASLDAPALEAGKATQKLLFQRFGKVLLVRVLALIFAFFLLAWHAPGQAVNIENMKNH